MQWPLEKCASLVNADADPVTRKLLISTEKQTHLHLEWQCSTLREQRRHLPTQLGKGCWSRRTHPGLGSGRSSLNIHDVHFLTSSTCILHSRVYQLERDRPSRRRPPTASVIPTTKKYSWGCDLVVGIGTRQLISLLHGAVGARGGWDRNPAYWIRARGRGDDLQNFCHSANVAYSPIRH
eukprot:2070287-Pleurochrysis_carterae.AAC.1